MLDFVIALLGIWKKKLSLPTLTVSRWQQLLNSAICTVTTQHMHMLDYHLNSVICTASVVLGRLEKLCCVDNSCSLINPTIAEYGRRWSAHVVQNVSSFHCNQLLEPEREEQVYMLISTESPVVKIQTHTTTTSPLNTTQYRSFLYSRPCIIYSCLFSPSLHYSGGCNDA